MARPGTPRLGRVSHRRSRSSRPHDVLATRFGGDMVRGTRCLDTPLTRSYSRSTLLDPRVSCASTGVTARIATSVLMTKRRSNILTSLNARVEVISIKESCQGDRDGMLTPFDARI